jgi:hypothetical protein
MQNNHLPIVFLFLLSFLSTNILTGQEVHTITLFVNTAEVTSQNTATQCSFGQEEGVSNEDYTIDAKVGDIIVWKGVSTNAPEADMVSIKSINHEGGVNIFGKNVLRGNGQDPEIVTAVVVQGAPGDVDKYKVSFRVFNDGSKRNGTFHIDPKIRIKP